MASNESGGPQEDTASAHEKLQIVGLFNTWWKRRHGIKVWYLIREGTCHHGRLFLSQTGQLVLMCDHKDERRTCYTALYSGFMEYTVKSAIPVIRWWPI